MQYEQLSFIDTSCPKMPQEFIGKEMKKTSLTLNTPREWTSDEIEWCTNLKKQGWSIKDIAESIGRDLTSVSIKMKRIKKADDTYNVEHLKEKYLMNDAYYEYLKPKNVLDVYSGKKHYWQDKCNCISNDIKTEFNATYHMDALKLLCQEYIKGNKYDLIDLDPYGSAFDCFDLAIKMAERGMIVTYGELGHKRWKRLDYVRNTYQIDSLEHFTVDTLISKTQEIAKHNHKQLTVWDVGNWRNISRVYYTIKSLKITEQWEQKHE